MPTVKAVAEVEELKAVLSEANLIISTDYRGLNVTELSGLRRAVREAGGTYRVAKNTLVKRAASEAGIEGLDDLFAGPTAIAFITGEPVDAAKALKKFAKEWLDYMSTVPVVWIDVPLAIPEPPKTGPATGPGTVPGGLGGKRPGGSN